MHTWKPGAIGAAGYSGLSTLSLPLAQIRISTAGGLLSILSLAVIEAGLEDQMIL